MQMTIPALLDALEGSSKGLIFVNRREEETHLLWSTLRDEAQLVAGALIAQGVKTGERVGLVYRTEPDFFRAFFGCLYAGAVPTPLYPPVRLGRLEDYHQRTSRMLEDADAVLVLASPQIRKLLGRAIAGAQPRLGCQTLQQLNGQEKANRPADADALGLVQFSSGTTRQPKPVALSQKALLAQASAILTTMKASFADHEVPWVGVSWLPLYHDMGLIGCVIPALIHDADLVLIRPEDFIGKPALWLRALSRHKGIISPAPNFAFGLCTQRIKEEDLEGVDLSYWRIAMNGAEAVQPSTLDAFLARFKPYGLREEAITPVYGLSEAALAVCFADFKTPYKCLENHERKGLVSVGRPLEGFEIEIRSEAGDTLDDGTEGLLWVKGPSLMEGYLNQAEHTAEVLQNGWLKTGDIALVNQGELYIVGRAKDLIILNGRNYAPDAIEAIVDGMPGIRRGCLAAVGWRKEGADSESLLLFVEHEKGASEQVLSDLGDACQKAILDAVQLQSHIAILSPGTLPRTSSGKIRRQEALNLYTKKSLLPPEKMGTFKLIGALWESRKHMPKTP